MKIRTGMTGGAQGVPEAAWLGPALELAANPQATLSEFVVSAGMTTVAAEAISANESGSGAKSSAPRATTTNLSRSPP